MASPTNLAARYRSKSSRGFTEDSEPFAAMQTVNVLLIAKKMAKKTFDRNALGPSEDWYGNNAALRCPVCCKTFIVSEFLNKGQRDCPNCHRSLGEITKEALTITWPDDQEIPTVWSRKELIRQNRLDEFVSLVKEGGAVEPGSVDAKLPKAEKIAFIERNGKFIAVAAKKRADTNYARNVAENSEYPLDRDTPELGYVEVLATCRRQRLSAKVVRRILFEFGDRSVFATTSNDRMKPVLAECGFRWVGKEWKSRRTGEMLSLWIRHYDR
jgi:hypothetical protein